MYNEKKGTAQQRQKIINYLTVTGPKHIRDMRNAAALGHLNNPKVKIRRKEINQILNHMVKIGLLILDEKSIYTIKP